MAALRARTFEAHARVDAAFGAFNLLERTDYRAFLLAHARALPTIETILSSNEQLPRTRPRKSLLAADLASLGQAMPAPLELRASIAGGSRWGILYVLEGSRFGGSILAARVAPDLPTAYLAAQHEPGEWRGLSQAIDTEAARHENAWLDQPVSGATACFELYAQACLAGNGSA